MRHRFSMIVACLTFAGTFVAFDATRALAETYDVRLSSAGAPTNTCLGIKENDLTHPFMAACKDYSALQWLMTPANKGGFVKFKSQRTGADVCLGVAARDTTTVVMAKCASVANQQWKLTASASDPHSYNVTSQLLGATKCLGIKAQGDRTEPNMNTCHDYKGQIWSVSY